MKRKLVDFRRILACIMFFVMTATIIPPITTEAAAQDSYSSYTMKKTGIVVPKYKQRGRQYCAVAASACLEAISLGINGDNNDAVYWGCWAACDGGKNMNYTGYGDVGKNEQSIYNKIKEGVPVVVWFEEYPNQDKGNKHWVTIVGYEGDQDNINKDDFVIMNPQDGSSEIIKMGKFLSDHLEYSWSKMTKAKVRESGKIDRVYKKTVNGKEELIVETKNVFRKLEANNIVGSNAVLYFDIDTDTKSNHTCNGAGFAISKNRNMSEEKVYETVYEENGKDVFPGQISFELNNLDNDSIYLMPGETYYWQAIIIKENVTIRSQVVNLLTGDIVPQEEIENPSTEPEVVMPEAPVTNGIKIGDTVNFGRRYWDININKEIALQLEEKERGYHEIEGTLYYTRGKDDTSGKVRGFSTIPIRWKVVGEDNESWLLLQEFVIFGHCYSSDLDAGIVTYGNSEIREYINSSDFLNSFFSQEQQEDILTTSISSGTETVNDKLFLPSFGELWSYFGKDNRKAQYYDSYYYGKPDVTTPISGWSDDYAYDTKNHTCAYWTRSSNFVRYGWSQPTYVNCYGGFSCGGRVFYTWSSGIRPMMRVKKNSAYISKAVTSLPEKVFDKASSDLLAQGSIEYGSYSFNISEELKSTKLPACIRYSDKTWTDLDRGLGNKITFAPGSVTICVLVGGMTSVEQELSKTTITVYPKKPVLTATPYFSESDPSSNKVVLKWGEDEKSDYIGTGNIEVARSTEKDGEYTVIYQGKADWVSGAGYVGYTDTDVQDGTKYWYKVRGLYDVYDQSARKTVLYTEINGIESKYSDPVQAGASNSNSNNNINIYSKYIPSDIDKNLAEGHCLMYRLYNPNTGEHFYTGSKREGNKLVDVGWNYEGIAWEGPVKSNTPVYRLYNPNVGEHHYTPSKRERDNLIKIGWNDEGIGWYSDDNKGKPLYRLYNPNATTGNHHYTTSTRERDKLVKIGWNDEGIGWYGYAQ